MSTERYGNWMHTVSGRRYWPLDPRPEEVYIEDIAHALANTCRFNGHVSRFYSVAEHCWLCSLVVPPEDAFEALMHDAAEAYLGDIIRPLKYMEVFHGPYREMERRNDEVIARRFQLRHPWPESVKQADEAVLQREMQELLSHSPHALDNSQNLHDASVAPASGIIIRGFLPQMAKDLFLSRFRQLANERAEAA